jgi:sugar lactone lactonase YvrE
VSARALRTLLEGGSFFEAPRWHEGRWWVSDFYRRVVLAVDCDGRVEVVMTVEGQPSGLGWMPDGSLLVVSMLDRRVLRRAADGRVSEHGDVSEHCRGHANDMVVDAGGRAYVGNLGFDVEGEDPAPAALVRVDSRGTASVAADDLLFPNGAVITADGRTLIVGETFGARYTAFTIDGSGALSDRRVWGQVAPVPELGPLPGLLASMSFAPDGCTLDAEGHIWAADVVGARCCRLAPGGAIVEEITAPEGLTVLACMLGGEDGRTLLLCLAPGVDPRARRDTRDAVLTTTAVEVPHAGLP